MKITAQNLRNIAEPVSLDITENIYLTGNNGTGKSTITTVPYYVLSGKGLSQKNGVSESMAGIEIGENTIFRYKQDNSTKLFWNDKEVTSVALSKELACRHLQVDVLTSLFAKNTKLTSNDLLKVAGMNLDFNQICSHITFESDVARKLLQDFFIENEIDVVDIPAIQKAYKYFVEMRKAKKKDIKAQEITLDNIAVDTSVDYKVQLNQLIQDITDITQQRTKAASDLAVIMKNITLKSQLEQSIVKNQEALKVIEKNVDQKEVFVMRRDSVIKTLENLDASVKKFTLQITEKEQTLNKKQNELNEIFVSLAGIQTDLSNKKALVNTLKTTTVCPLYAGISCTVNKEAAIYKLNSETTKLMAELDQKQLQKNTLQADIAGLKDEISVLKTNKEEERSRILSQEKLKQELIGNLNEIARNEQTQAIFKENVENAQKSLDALPQQQPEMLKQAVQGFDEKVSQLSTQKNALQNALEQQIKKATLQKTLEKEIELNHNFDFLVKELKKLPGSIFSKITKPLQDTADNILSALKPDWKIEFKSDNDKFLILLHTLDGIIDADELSTGETVLLNYLLKALICQLTNFDTIILDDVDTLDKKHLRDLNSVIQNSPFKTVCVSANPIPTEIQGSFKVVTLKGKAEL